MSIFFLFSNTQNVYAEDEYTITYIFGTDSIVENKTVDVDYEILGSTFEKDGYTQIGWSLLEDGATLDYEFNEIYNLNDDLILYPKFEINTYKIHVENIEIEDIDVEYGDTFNIQVVLKTGYTFIGYFDEENGQGNKITDNTGLCLNIYNFLTDIIVYPYYEVNSYKIVYNDIEELTSKDVVYDEMFILDIPTIIGKAFMGWYSEENGQGNKITDEQGQSIEKFTYTSYLDVYPYFEDITININYSNFNFIKKDGIKSFILEATVYPEGSSNVTFFTSNKDVAIVSNDGLVECVGIGNANIIAQLDNGGNFKYCEIQSVDYSYGDGNYPINVIINNKDSYYVLGDEEENILQLSESLKDYVGIENDYVIRNQNNEVISKYEKLSNKFNLKEIVYVNFIYKISKKVGYTNFNIQQSAEFGQDVYLKDIYASSNYSYGKISVNPAIQDENVKYEDVLIYQGLDMFIMPNYDVEVSVLIKEINISTETFGDIYLKAKDGFKTQSKVSIYKTDSFSSKFIIPENKYVILSLRCEMKIEDTVVEPNSSYTMTLNIPEELYGKDGIEIMLLEGDNIVYKQVLFENDKISFTANSMGDILFIANVHESIVDLSWLVILFAFLDTLLFALDIILFVKYYELKQKNKGAVLNSYIMPFMILSVAVQGGILAASICLVVLFVGELGFMIWLLHKLTNEKYLKYDEDFDNTHNYKID